VVSPVLPFLTEHLWQRLVADVDPGAPRSVFLAGWPDAPAPDDERLAEIGEVRRVVDLARQARATSNLKLRQPLRRLVVQGAPRAQSHANEIAEELRVKEVEFGEVEATELEVKPNLPILGPKLGKELGAIRSALQRGAFEELEGGRFRVNGHVLEPDEVLVARRGREGWAVADDDGITVALDTTVDAELEREARVLDLIHALNSMRKDASLELTDRIRVTLPERDRDLEPYLEWIGAEVLAVEASFGDVDEPKIEQT
jgi:isoleucyl-tRNA synthetase